MNWKPLITDSNLKKQIIDKINVIAEEVLRSPSNQPYLLGDNAGISIFWDYHAAVNKNIYSKICAVDSINSAFSDNLSQGPSWNFSSGLAGILWAYNYLSKNNEISVSWAQKIRERLIDVIYQNSISELKHGHYDYLHKGLGPIVYFLDQNIDTINKYIAKVLKTLNSKAENVDEGITWIDIERRTLDKKETYNLGLSHGIASIIALLSLVIEKDQSKVAQEMLERVVGWLLAQKDNEPAKYLFPFSCPAQKPYIGRVAWCYGDLGISVALLRAGMITSNDKWYNEAINIAINAAKIRGAKSGVLDACFCHGSAGNAHIFNRLYQYTNIENFKEAAIYWFMQTLDFYDKHGYFKVMRRDINTKKPKFETEYGILEGIAGVGLALLSAITDIEPKWDRCLLLS